jgi:hypothetical protein
MWHRRPVAGFPAREQGSLMTDNTASGRPDDAALDADGNGAGSESPEEGAAAQRDADEAADMDASPAGEIS